MAGIWNRNYYNILSAYLLGDTTLTSTQQPTDYTPPIMLRRGTGAWFNAPQESTGNMSMSNDQKFLIGAPFLIGKGGVNIVTNSDPSLSSTGISLGTGTTPATFEDYTMESFITSGLAITNSAGTLTTPSTYDSNTHYYKSERSFTINNTSNATKTITELGIWIPSRYNSITYGIMVYHEVFDEAITLAPAESIVIKFTRNAEIYNYTPYPQA